MSDLHQQQEILKHAAKACINKKFKYGASFLEAPFRFDCSSLVQFLYSKVGIQLPRSAIQQAHLGKKVFATTLEVGDLLFFHGTIGHYNQEFPQGIGHVAMYIGDGKIIQATGSVGRVIVSSQKEMVTRKDLIVIKRVLEQAFKQSSNSHLFTFFDVSKIHKLFH